MRRSLLIFSMVFSWVLAVSAQEKASVKTVKGTYTYEIPATMSYAQACQAALVKAQNAAIAEKFGSNITEDNTLFTSNVDGKSTVNFHSMSRNQVRGVWLGDEEKPKYEKFTQDNRDWVKVTVKGKARELVNAGVELEVAPLRYMPDKELATDVFKDHDDMFLYFKSPIDGYLTVFLFDVTSDQVFALLPYSNSGTGSYRINHDEEYYFFSEKKAKPDDGKVEELVTTITEGLTEEYNNIYVIFSPNSFAKISSKVGQQKLSDTLVVPSSLGYKEFNAWLTKYQQKDEQMQVERIPIKITKN